MQTALKSQLAGLTHRTRVDRLLGALTGIRDLPLVLGYHRVVRSYKASAPLTMPSMLVSQAMLERQLDWTAKHYTLISLDELHSRLASGVSTRRVAAVTIDDGYRDFFEHGFPIFKKKGLPATIFVVTDLVGTSDLQRHDKLYLLVERDIARGGHLLDRLL